METHSSASAAARTPAADTGRESRRDTSLAWQDRGACRGLDAVIFYPDPEDEVGTERALAVCSGCQVSEACLEHALTWREHTGIWGGATERDRRRILRRRRRSA
ncbi:MAG: WhiB family transcriptional regulator [Acidimicrobiales bacterium]|jgi:WhiB family redox-sensing transcriptional regulator|nr:WhiB family transcriptional regulator [Acidimicrobiales bacterium]|tara:strand:+ start:312 stop:623 length:312 start_codon:yes stop_codon:yes gene_type:complete